MIKRETLYFVVSIILFLGATSATFGQERIRGMSGNIEVLGYLMADEEYDSVILKANEYLMNGNVSYKDEGTIVSYIVEAIFQKGQYGDFSQDFEAFAKGFPESPRLPYLYFLETQSRNFRRHYYDAILAGDMGIRTAKGGDRKVESKILKEVAMILEDNILDHQLYTLYDDVHKKVKVPIVTAMIDRGLDPPVDSTLLIPEYDDIWRDRATSHFFRGSAVFGTVFPFFGINGKYNEDNDGNPIYPKVKNGLAADISGTYRLLNGIGLGASVSFARWTDSTYARVAGSDGTTETADSIPPYEKQSAYVSGMGVVRFYLPKIRKKVQIFFEPGAGISYFSNWKTFDQGDWFFTAKGDLGLTFNRTFEVRASYKMLQANGYTNYWEDPDKKELYHWVSASIGLVLRRYSSKSRRKGGNIDRTDVMSVPIEEEEVEEVVEEPAGIPIPTIEEEPEPEVEEEAEPITEEESTGSSIFDNYK